MGRLTSNFYISVRGREPGRTGGTFGRHSRLRAAVCPADGRSRGRRRQTAGNDFPSDRLSDRIVWEKDGLRLNGRQKVQILNSSLAIDPLDKASDAGVYSCEARQHGGLSARQSFQLNVIVKSVSLVFVVRQMRMEIADGQQTRRI